MLCYHSTIPATAGPWRQKTQNKPNSPKPAGGPLEGEMCKTNPISGGSAGTGATERAKRTQSAGRTGWDGARGTRGVGLSRQTKPIPDGRDRGQMCKTSPIRAGGCRHPWDRTCETNPISRRGQVGRGPGDAGQPCKTNPISGGWDIPPFHYSIIPTFPSDARCTNKANSAILGLLPNARQAAV